MSICFTIFIIMMALVGISLLISKTLSEPTPDNYDPTNYKKIWRRASLAPLVLGIVFFILSCLQYIGTNDYGVVKNFGKPTGSMSNGLHLKAPWESVSVLDAKIQTDTYASHGFNGRVQDKAAGGCIDVRLARQATACVNVFIRWQLNRNGIDYLYRNFKTMDNIRDNLLHKNLQTAVNRAFANYDPLGLDAQGNSTQPTTDELSAAIDTAMAEQDANLNIISVSVPIFNFDSGTQERLNGLNQQVAQTRIAQQAELTAKAQAKAAKTLDKAHLSTPALIQNCLNIVNESIQKQEQLPAGFTCFPSGGANTAIPLK